MDKRIKIGIVSPFNPFEVRDYIDEKYSKYIYNNNIMATSVLALVIGFLKLKYHVVVFTYDSSLNKEVEYHGDLLDIYAIPLRFFNKKIRIFGLFRRLYMGFYLSKLIRNHMGEFSVLHAQWTYDYAKACIPFSLDFPVFCTVRDWCPYIMSTIDRFSSRLFWIISWIVYRKVISCNKIHFIANSYYTYSRLLSKNYTDVPIIFNSIREDFIRNDKFNNLKRHIFISIADNLCDKRKNIKVLLKAFKRYREEDKESELWLVGDGCDLLKKQNDKLLDNVRFYGKVNHSDLKRLLDKSSVLVHPSLEETFGNIVLEAMARRIPVIGGNNSGAIPLLLENGKYGFLCDIKDPISICKAMHDVVNNSEMVQAVVDKSWHYLYDNFVDYKVAQKHIDLYMRFVKIDS